MIKYECCDCGGKGCKLWRDYQCFLENLELRCAECAGKNQNKDVADMNPEGKRPYQMVEGGIVQWTDQIGWLVPAVPTEDGETFWGYTSVPQEGVDWWKNLPNSPQKEEEIEWEVWP